MTNKQYKKIKDRAEMQVNKIDSFIEQMMTEDKYFALSTIVKRLLMKSNDSDIEDICFELDLGFNIKTFKVDSLAEEMKFEQFISDLKENPYQLKLIA
jgi:hypothetical protein